MIHPFSLAVLFTNVFRSDLESTNVTTLMMT